MAMSSRHARTKRLAPLLADTNLAAAFAAVQGGADPAITVTRLPRRPGTLSMSRALEIIEAAIRDTDITLTDVLEALDAYGRGRERRRAGGRARGRGKTREAIVRDAEIAGCLRRFAVSDELRERYRTSAAYVVEHTGLSRATVYRRLKLLQSHKLG